MKTLEFNVGDDEGKLFKEYIELHQRAQDGVMYKEKKNFLNIFRLT